MVSNIEKNMFTPKLGKDEPNLTNIFFQMAGFNHQPGLLIGGYNYPFFVRLVGAHRHKMWDFFFVTFLGRTGWPPTTNCCALAAVCLGGPVMVWGNSSPTSGNTAEVWSPIVSIWYGMVINLILPSLKLRWYLKMDGWKTRRLIFRGRTVSFRKGIICWGLKTRYKL